mgnify:CR=1 FL=1
MNKKTTFILTFLGSGIAMFLIFYFYPARIFDVELVSPLAENAEVVSLKVFLKLDKDFTSELAANSIVMKRQLSGWMILFICLLGLPAMIGYRVAFTKRPAEDEHSKEDAEVD